MKLSFITAAAIIYLQLFNLSAHAESSDELHVLYQKQEQLEALMQESIHFATEEDMPKIMKKYYERSEVLQKAIKKLEVERETLIEVTLKINNPKAVLTKLRKKRG